MRLAFFLTILLSATGFVVAGDFIISPDHNQHV